jgi:hypothetical protein
MGGKEEREQGDYGPSVRVFVVGYVVVLVPGWYRR